MTLQEEEKIGFYTFPRDISSHNICTKNCLMQTQKVFRKFMVCKYIQGWTLQ